MLMLFGTVSRTCGDDGDLVYDKTSLLNVRIDIEEKQWNKARRQTRNIVESFTDAPTEPTFTWVKAKITINDHVIPEAAIRKKGFLGSLDTERPSLKIDLNKYDSDEEFDGIDNLTLNNCKQDRSLVSQYLTYESFRKIGLPAPRISFAKVTVNGKYLGIYANVEPVKKKFLRRNFGNTSGELYEGTVTDFYSNSLTRFQHKYGDETPSDWRQLLLDVAQILDTKPLDMSALSKYIDPDEFLRFWALESLIGFWDGYCSNQNNYFVYHNPVDSRFHFIPWGADVAFSRSWFGLMFKRGTPQCANIRARIPHAMYNDPVMQARYFETLDKLLDEFWNEDKLIAETNRIEALLSDHLAKSQRDFKKEIEATRLFIRSRRDELAKERENGPPEWAGQAGIPPVATLVGSATGTFTTVWSETQPKNPTGHVTLKVTLDGKDFEITDLTVSLFPGGNSRNPRSVPNSQKLVISGKSPKKKRVVLSLSIGPGFPSVTGPLRCQGGLTDGVGGGFFNPPVERSAFGTVKLDKATQKGGQPVEGDFVIRIYKFEMGN
jgi:spore coat protein CotH